MTRFATALILAMLAMPVGSSAIAQPSISEESIRAIETQIVMPRDAPTLGLYDRYYAPDQFNGREVVVGVFLLRASFGGTTHTGAAAVAAIPNAFTTSRQQLPLIADGGCSVVTIYFDLATQRLLPISQKGVDAEPELAACNGLG